MGGGIPGETPDEAIAKAIIDAAEVHSPPNVFVLGPYARRINFAAQQNRALNLIWALKTLGRIEKGHSIAVIGGGLAGMMAAASLLDLNCKVELYEEHSKLLWRQRNTSHRVLNPDINRWPDGPMGCSTELPFCDWYQDECEKALDKICAGWEEYVKDRMGPPHFNRPILKPRRMEKKVGLMATPPITEGPFDAVIVATGFLGEHTLDPEGRPDATGTVSYWNGDGLEALCADINQTFAVSGCGDGGLIDVLRIVYPHFDYGRLAIEIASLIGQKAKAAEIIRQGEAEAEKIIPRLLSDMTSKERKEAVAKSIDEAAEKLFKTYDDAVQALEPYVRERLKLVDQFDVVTLVSMEIKPFSRMAAPIHKLMVHYAYLNSKVTYLSGKLKADGATVCIHKRNVSGDGFEAVGDLVNNKTIVRHGARPAIERREFLDPAILEDLKKRQDLLSDKLNHPFWKGGEDGKGSHPDYKKVGPKNVERRVALVYDALREKTKNYMVAFRDGKFCIDYFGAVPDDKLPSSMFGSDLKPAPCTEYMAIE